MWFVQTLELVARGWKVPGGHGLHSPAGTTEDAIPIRYSPGWHVDLMIAIVEKGEVARAVPIAHITTSNKQLELCTTVHILGRPRSVKETCRMYHKRGAGEP